MGQGCLADLAPRHSGKTCPVPVVLDRVSASEQQCLGAGMLPHLPCNHAPTLGMTAALLVTSLSSSGVAECPLQARPTPATGQSHHDLSSLQASKGGGLMASVGFPKKFCPGPRGSGKALSLVWLYT